MIQTLIYWAGITVFIAGFLALSNVLSFEVVTAGVLAVLFMRPYTDD